MLVVAQTMVLVCAGCGLMMFLYVHLFSYRRLRRQEHRLDRDEARADRAEAAVPEPGTALAAPGLAPAQTEAALFCLYQEQVRRFIDAKIDIMRAAADTQNRLVLIHAETEREAVRRGGTIIDIVPEEGPVGGGTLLPARREQTIGVFDQLRTVRSETERHLAEIDQQIRALPGPSLHQWAVAMDEA
ncbi:MAG: hypothetical protein WCJ64_06530 [Rhodospirillaceae bacterium]